MLLILLCIGIGGGIGGAAFFLGGHTTRNSQKSSSNHVEKPNENEQGNQKALKNIFSCPPCNQLLSDILVGSVAAIIGFSVAMTQINWDFSIVTIKPSTCYTKVPPAKENVQLYQIKEPCKVTVNDKPIPILQAQLNTWLYLWGFSMLAGFLGIRLIEAFSAKLEDKINNSVDEKSEDLKKALNDNLEAAKKENASLRRQLDERTSKDSMHNSLLLRASNLFDKDEYTDALEVLTTAKAIKNDARVLGQLALAHSYLDNSPTGWKQALELSDEAIEKMNEENTPYREDRGYIYYNRACYKALLEGQDGTISDEGFKSVLEDLECSRILLGDFFIKKVKDDCQDKEDLAIIRGKLAQHSGFEFLAKEKP